MASNVQFQQSSTVRNVPLPNNPFPNNPLSNAQIPGLSNAQMPGLSNTQMPGADQAKDMAHRIGEAVTGGDTHTGYLASYIAQLQKNPFRTRMLTSGSLAGLQELLASWLARDRSKHGHYFSSRIPKMALYGAFISAPMGHFLIRVMQWMFAKRTSLKAKILQILVSNLIVSSTTWLV
jgi:hypothetical protein